MFDLNLNKFLLYQRHINVYLTPCIKEFLTSITSKNTSLKVFLLFPFLSIPRYAVLHKKTGFCFQRSGCFVSGSRLQVAPQMKQALLKLNFETELKS